MAELILSRRQYERVRRRELSVATEKDMNLGIFWPAACDNRHLLRDLAFPSASPGSNPRNSLACPPAARRPLALGKTISGK